MKTPRRRSARPASVQFRICMRIMTAAVLCLSLAALGRNPYARQNPAVQATGQGSAQDQQAIASPAPSQAYDGGSPLGEKSGYWVTGQKGELPRSALYADATGALGIVNLSGPIDTLGHPFFTPLGTNGRACVTCHQPGNGMSISTATLQRRWAETSGQDPVFAAVDGANCPDLPQGQASSHTLLLQHGLFRIYLPWPPRAADGSSMNPEFAIQVVRDPTGCNTSTKYGLKSSNSMISVFRRPRPIANMKYPMSPFGLWSPKTGEVLPIDPETKKRENLNILADNRQPSLEAQAVDAAFSHEQATDKPSRETLQHLVAFEMQIYAAQSVDSRGGSLTTGAIKAGPQALIDGMPAMLADYNGGSFPELDGWLTSTAVSSQRWDRNTVRPEFPAMREGAEKETPVETAFRDSVARGYEMFRSRDISDQECFELQHHRPRQPVQTAVRKLPQHAADRHGFLAGLHGSRHNESTNCGSTTMAAAFQGDVQSYGDAPPFSGASHLHARSGPRTYYGQVCGRGVYKHAAVPRACRPRTIFLEWFGENTSRHRRLL